MSYPDVGLIYAHADSEFAHRVLGALNARGIASASLDTHKASGRAISDMLSETNNACRVILYLKSQASNDSIWTGNDAFPMVELGLRIRDPALIPIILDRSPIPVDLTKLQAIQGIDASGRDFAPVINEIIQAVEFYLSKKHVFICHSSKDHDMVRQVLQKLDRMHPNCDYWFDSDPVPGGVDIEVGIRAAISRANYILVFMTRNLVETYQESKFLKLEFELAKERERFRRKKGGFFVITSIFERRIHLDQTDFSWLDTNTLIELIEERESALKRILELINTPISEGE